MRIYLDSCVFISFIKKEFGWNLRPLYLEAEYLFEWIKDNNHTLVLSPLFFFEVQKKAHLEKESVLEEFHSLGISLEMPPIPKELQLSTFTRLGIHSADAAHLAYAIETKCDMIVTFNIKDFEPAQLHIKIAEPTRLI